MRRYVLCLLVLLAMVGLIFLTACPSPPGEPVPPPPPSNEEKPPVTPEPESETEKLPEFPLTVIDDLDRTVVIEKLPQRIVSLAPSNTEIVFALGLEDRLVGVSDYCDYPEAAKAKPRVAGYSSPDMERLVSLEPDLVLAEAIHENTVLPALENLGLTVIVGSAASIDAVLHGISLIGEINGKSEVAAQLVDDLSQRVEAVTVKTENLPVEERPGVLYVCWHDPIWTMGSETFISDLIWKAGGVNIFADDFEKSRVVSLESVVAENPQIILITGMASSINLSYNSIKQESRLSTVDARVNDRVYKISDSNLIERPGPRIVDGLEEVAKLIHPEIFGKFE